MDECVLVICHRGRAYPSFSKNAAAVDDEASNDPPEDYNA